MVPFLILRSALLITNPSNSTSFIIEEVEFVTSDAALFPVNNEYLINNFYIVPFKLLNKADSSLYIYKPDII